MFSTLSERFIYSLCADISIIKIYNEYGYLPITNYLYHDGHIVLFKIIRIWDRSDDNYL